MASFIGLESTSIFSENSDASTLIFIPQNLPPKIITPETIVRTFNPTADSTITTLLSLAKQASLPLEAS